MCTVRGITRKFFWGGIVIFPNFFPVENFHYGRPKTNFTCFEKWKEKKKKKKKGPLFIFHFGTFSTFHFQFLPSFLQFFFFSSPFPPFSIFFLASFFPVGQQKFPGQKSLGGTLPHAPRLLCHCTVGKQKYGDFAIEAYLILYNTTKIMQITELLLTKYGKSYGDLSL